MLIEYSDLDNALDEEKAIIQEVLKCKDKDWNFQEDNLVLKYLFPYFQDGIEVLVDDGYPLYVQDCEKEMRDYMLSQISNNDLLEASLVLLFGDSQSKKDFFLKYENILRNEYKNHAPSYHRSLSDYMKYADSPETRKEYEDSYRAYLKAIDDLENLSVIILHSLSSSRQTKNIIDQTIAIDLFINRLELLKDKNFYESLTYESNMPVQDLFYQEVFMSEDFERILHEVINSPIKFSSLDNRSHLSYSLDDIYQMIPEDVLSDELLSNEEFDPNNLNFQIRFVQDFYQLCLLFCSDAKDDKFKDTINQFLMRKVESFQEQFYDSFSDNEDDDEYQDQSYKHVVYVKKREDETNY